MKVAVKNLHGTSGRKPKGYSSWEEFWIAHKGYWPTYCSASDCCNKAKVGAHVIKVYGSNKWYIVPLCKACNAREDIFYVDDSLLVPVNDND